MYRLPKILSDLLEAAGCPHFYHFHCEEWNGTTKQSIFPGLSYGSIHPALKNMEDQRLISKTKSRLKRGDESIPKKGRARKPTRVQQIFLYIAPAPALAFFKIWASLGREPDSLLAAGCAMLAYCAFILVVARHWDKPTYFDWTVCGYFFVLVACLALWPSATGAIITEYAVTGIYTCLFVTAFFPPVLDLSRSLITLPRSPRLSAVWVNPIFVTINRIITFTYAGIFAVWIVLSLYPSVVTRALNFLYSSDLRAALPFMLRFPDYYLKRLGLPSQAEDRNCMSP